MRRGLAAACLGLLLGGCQVGSGDGWLRGTMFLPSCGFPAAADGGADASVSVPLRYFFGDVVGDRLDLRFQNSGTYVDTADGLLLTLRNRHDVVAALRTAGSVEVPVYADLPPVPVTGPDLVARASLYLNATCSGVYVDFSHGVGTIVFTSLYARLADGDYANIDRIAGSFTGLSFVDPRPELAVDGVQPRVTLDGSFDFDYTRGRPAQPFP